MTLSRLKSYKVHYNTQKTDFTPKFSSYIIVLGQNKQDAGRFAKLLIAHRNHWPSQHIYINEVTLSNAS